jgi:hypothetical protein
MTLDILLVRALEVLGAGIMGSAITSGVVAAPTSTSQLASAAVGGTATLKNFATGSCLDSNRSGSVSTTGCNGASSQRWQANSGATTLRNIAYGSCLDSNSSGSVYTAGCNGAGSQQWQANSGTTTLRNIAYGSCLDSNSSGSVYTAGCNGAGSQQWQ